MKIKLHSGFKKAFKIRIAPNKKLVLQTEEKIALFQTNRENPILKDHSLLANFTDGSYIY